MDSETQFFTVSKTSRRIDDLVCVRCFVQPTSYDEPVCELCRALGRNVDPVSKSGLWSDIRFGGICAKRLIFGLNA